MISVEEVKACLKAITQLDDETLDEKEALIENAICFVEKIIKSISADDKPRAVMLAAARANYFISLLNDEEDYVSSFKAGDVSFTRTAASSQSAKAFYDSTLEENADLIKESGFVFRTV